MPTSISCIAITWCRTTRRTRSARRSTVRRLRPRSRGTTSSRPNSTRRKVRRSGCVCTATSYTGGRKRGARVTVGRRIAPAARALRTNVPNDLYYTSVTARHWMGQRAP
ncbi:protein of unknown function [Burkholderia multivorans]